MMQNAIGKKQKQNGGKLVSLLVVVGVLLSSIPFVPQAKAAADTDLYFNPASASVAVNDDFNLVATIDPTTTNAVSSVELHITFDQTKLRLDSITPSSTFSLELQAANINNTNGTASIAVGVPLASPSVTTISSVATFAFHALATATNSPVDFTTASIAAADGESGNVIVTRTGATVTVTGDTTAPTITNVSSDKANGSYTVGEVIDIDVTFSEAVTSTGSVTVTLETGTTDRTCTFTVSNSATGTCNYTVQAGDTSSDLTVNSISGTIADQSSNAMTNFVPATNLAANKALVIDTTAPTISTLSPTDGATGISETANLVLTFDTAVNVGTGNVTIKLASDDSTVEAIDVTGGQVTGTGTNVITVNPSVTLGATTAYYVQVATTAFDDIAGNSYAGITDTTSWNFTTTDSGSPIRSAGSPSGALAAGTTSTTVSLTTNESATCKYGTTAGTAYASIADTFSTTGGTSHSFTASGLSNGTSYAYYVRCQDGATNANTDDYTVSFSVASPSVSNDDDDDDEEKEEKEERKITESKKKVRRGDYLIQRGENFSKNAPVALYFSKSDGTYYKPVIIKTRKSGAFMVKYRVNKPAGKYKWYAVNLKTGWKSKTLTYTVK